MDARFGFGILDEGDGSARDHADPLHDVAFPQGRGKLERLEQHLVDAGRGLLELAEEVG